MKCLNEEEIQRYIDKNLTEEQRQKVEFHLLSCESCRTKQENHISFLALLKEMNREYEYTDIPPFTPPIIQPAKINRFIYSAVAAGFALILMTTYSLYKKSNGQEKYMIFYHWEDDFDSNKPFADQKLDMNLVDEDGNILNDY